MQCILSKNTLFITWELNGDQLHVCLIFKCFPQIYFLTLLQNIPVLCVPAECSAHGVKYQYRNKGIQRNNSCHKILLCYKIVLNFLIVRPHREFF